MCTSLPNHTTSFDFNIGWVLYEGMGGKASPIAWCPNRSLKTDVGVAGKNTFQNMGTLCLAVH